MDVPSTQVAIVGCGLAGCGVVTILKESFSKEPIAPAFLIAVDDNAEALNNTQADKKILVSDKLDTDIDLSRYAVVFFVLEPSETSSLTWAQVLSSLAMAKKVYSYGFLIKPSGGWPEDEKTVFGSFDGSALVDEGWVFEARKGKAADAEYAMRIVFNFTAHTLAFMAEAIRTGKLSQDALLAATYGKVAGFAATSISQPESLFLMTMSKISREQIKSVILFMPEDTDNMAARRTFLYVSKGLPRSIEMIALRIKYVEPFRIVALLAS